MDIKRATILGFGCFMMLGAAATTRAQCTIGTAAVQYQDTFVEPEFTDCPAVATWGGDGWGGAGGNVNANKLDQDAWWGANEDLDLDAVYMTIQCAISRTLPGGTVHVTVPGVYRETLTITDIVTIRGGEGMDVIIDGSQQACNAFGAVSGITINSAAAANTVRLENLTIRGFSGGAGVNIVADTALVEIVDCRIDGNEWGVVLGALQAATSRVDVIDCEISRNDLDGINLGSGSPARLAVNGTQIWSNGRDGIRGSWETGFGPVLIQSSRVRSNGGNGIFISGNQFGAQGMKLLTISGSSINENVEDGINTSGVTSSLVITDSEISRNGDEGIEFNNAGILAAVNTLSVGDCRIEHNGGIGMKVTSAAGGAVMWSVWRSTFVVNTGVAIDDIGLPMPNASCALGGSLFAVNAGGGGPAANFNGLGAGTCNGGAPNQVQ